MSNFSRKKFRINQISSTLIFASAVKYISHWQVTCHYFLTPVLFHSQIHGMLLELFDSRKIIDQIITSKKRSSALHSYNTAGLLLSYTATIQSLVVVVTMRIDLPMLSRLSCPPMLNAHVFPPIDGRKFSPQTCVRVPKGEFFSHDNFY